MEFAIPLNKEDLLTNRACDGYSIKNLYDPAILGEKLEDYNAQFRNEGPISILNNFDVLYSLLHHSSRLKEDLKQQAWKILLSNVSIHVNSLPMVLHPDCVESEERKQQLCAFKMEAYILTQFVEGFESDAAKPDITADIGKKGKSVKKKSQMSWDWSVERNHVLVLINQLLQLDIQHLWDPPVVEEDFVNLFSGVCYKMLENPTVVRQKEDREMLINILGQLIKRYNHHLGASMKIIQLLQHFEHLVSPLAQALTTFVLRFGAKNLVCDVIREIGRMDSSDLSRDASGTRSFSQFIVEIAYKIPNQVLPNISLLMSHLDGDSYTMRNGVLGVFGEIVIKILSREDLDDSMKKSREGFLDKLGEHIHDIHAFVRSKDLQVWIRLCQEKAIPISRQARIIDLVIGRLSDKSSQVRKYAVQFLKASLIGNPFAAKLPIEQLKSSLEKETEMLTQMDAPANLNGNEQESQQYITEMEEDSEKEPENQMELDLEALQQPQEDVEDPDSMAKKMELEKQKVLVNYLKACVKFAEQMRKAIPALCQLLQSKTSSDVLETIDFFIASHEFGLSHSEEGIRRMANLVWSRDAVVKKAVVNAFERLYIDISCENPRNKPTMIIQSLTSLINDANLGELTSLEELMYELMKLELIPQSIIHLLWQRFSLKIPDTSSKDQRIAITILSMIAGAEKDIIKSNLSVLAEYGFNGNDFLLARDTCTAIQKLLKKEKDFVGGEPFRLASDHNLFLRLEKLLTEGLYRTDQLTWTPFSEQALAVIYNLSESPDTITGRILKTFVNSLLGESSADNQDETGDGNKKAHPLIVARVLSAAGHIALLYLYHLDVSIFNELKRRHAVREEENVNKGGAPKAKIPNGRRKSMRESSASTISSLNKESGLDEEMGVGGAAAEDAEADYIRKICDNEVVLGQNLLSIFASVAVMICSNPSKFKKPELRSSAALTLAKFMLVSAEFCVQHLQLLFTILEKSDTPTVRSNMMIALGDLCFRFPNHIEPWTSHLYARLRDESVEVRKTTVTILTHLILNDMLKVKGQISEMAICLEDEEEKIASSAKMLFSELGRKGNALYNIAPDIISRLSDPDAGIDEKMFRTIMKFILQFIQKDKQAESLVEKLCHRFRATRTDRQWRDLSFCLSVLPYNEKTLKKLMENIRCYHDKLSDEEVFCFFTAIIAKSKKFAKAEFKTLVDEFESTLEGYHNKGTQENADVDKTKKALALVNDKNTTELNQSRKLTRAKSKSKLKPWELEDSDDNDQDCDDDGNKENRKTLPGKKRKTHRKEQKTVRLNPIFSSDDDDLFD